MGESIPTIILCGGRGTRISDYNPTLPKPLVPIGNKPILWHIMKIYATYGHTDFVLALGWLGEEIRRFFLQYEALTRDFTIEFGAGSGIQYLHAQPDDGWKVTCVDTGVDSLTGTRVRLAAAHLGDGPIMVTYGDGVGSIDVDALLAFHRAKGKLATITAVQPPSRFGELVVDKDGLAREFAEKPQTSAERHQRRLRMIFEARGDRALLPHRLRLHARARASRGPGCRRRAGRVRAPWLLAVRRHATRAVTPRRSVDERRGALAGLGALNACMKVLVLSNMYPPHHYGGYELSCRDVVDRWRERGHDVTVLTSTMRAQNAKAVPLGHEPGIKRDLTTFFEDGALVRPPLWRQLGVERTNQRILADTLKTVRPDVVSIWAMGAMSTGLLATLVESGVPLVFSVCDDWPTYAYKIDPWMSKWYKRPRLGRMVERIVGVPSTLPDLGRAGTFCFISENTRLRCEEYSPWSFSDATIVYNGIDLEAFPILDHEPERPWRWKLVAAGRLDPRKGFETAIRALALLPPEAVLELLPSVDDPYRARLEEVAAEVGVSDRVQYRIVTRSELRDRYEDADVCLFPTEWDEPFGLVPLEAMARGTPVIATGSGGSGEFLIDGVNCLRCHPKDPRSLADAVTRLAADPSLRQRIASGGLATAAELNVDRLAEVLEQWHVAAADHFVHDRPPHRQLLTH